MCAALMLISTHVGFVAVDEIFAIGMCKIHKKISRQPMRNGNQQTKILKIRFYRPKKILKL